MQSSVSTIELPPEHLRDAFFACVGDFVMLPKVASQALELSKDADCSAVEFSSVVEKDVALTTELLSLANSALFGGDSPVMTVGQAMVRLGLRQCRNLILSSSAASLMRKLPMTHEWVREVICQHSFVTATACLHLNRALNLGFQGEEFTAGLLHDFGRILLAIADPDVFAKADPLTFEESCELLNHEREILGTDHAAFGAWFASHNGLPMQLVNVVAHHHSPEANYADKELIALTAVADDIANHLQRHESVADYDPSGNVGLPHLNEIAQQRFLELANSLITDIAEDTQPARLPG
jgi:HD-like signal output (HDOD) protein